MPLWCGVFGGIYSVWLAGHGKRPRTAGANLFRARRVSSETTMSIPTFETLEQPGRAGRFSR